MLQPGLARVLLVEDDKELGESLAEVLEEFGYEVEIAADAVIALQWTKDRFFSLILIDVSLRGSMNGWSLLTQLKLDPRCLGHLAMCSGGQQSKLRPQAQAEQVPFFSKPFELDELLELIEKSKSLPA